LQEQEQKRKPNQTKTKPKKSTAVFTATHKCIIYMKKNKTRLADV
jgi:hypothetical protein